MRHPDECGGVHTPKVNLHTDSNADGPIGKCTKCGTTETEAWAHGEKMYRHMHDYEVDDGSVVRCQCGAWLPRPWHAGKLEDGLSARRVRLERLGAA